MVWVPCRYDWLLTESVYRFDKAAQRYLIFAGISWPPLKKWVAIEPHQEIRQWFYENEIHINLIKATAGRYFLGFEDPTDAFAFKMRFG